MLNDLGFHLSVPTTKTFLRLPFPNMPSISFLMGSHRTITHMSPFFILFIFIRRFLRAAQASRKVRLASDLYSNSFHSSYAYMFDLSAKF